MKGLKDMYQCLISFSPDFYFLKTVICLFERQSGRQETEGERERVLFVLILQIWP